MSKIIANLYIFKEGGESRYRFLYIVISVTAVLCIL